MFGATLTRIVTKYYYAGGQRITMRQGPAGQAGTVSYFVNDHLGSTSLITNDAGGQVSYTRYYPYGRVRSQTPPGSNPPTDKLFTGQQRETAAGVYHYNARMYSADTGRFPQADTVVPDTTDPQALNRYAYVRNSPAMYTDPTGHLLADDECGNRQCTPPCEYSGTCPPPAPVPQPPSSSPTPTPTPTPTPAPSQIQAKEPTAADYASSYAPADCAISGGRISGIDCSHWEQEVSTSGLGGLIADVMGVIRSDCFQGLVAVTITAIALSSAATGVGTLVQVGGVAFLSASSAATSTAAIYYAAGPGNVEKIFKYGPSGMYKVYTEC